MTMTMKNVKWHWFLAVLWILAGLGAAGCASNSPGNASSASSSADASTNGTSDLQPVSTDPSGEGMETTATGAVAQSLAVGLDYRIAPLDIIQVDVVGETNLSKVLRVSSSGAITVPYVGKIQVENLTAAEVETKVQQLLDNGYIVNPQVIVTVKEYRKRFVTVIGEVNQQGPVEFNAEQPLNIIEAIGLAGGPTQLAKDTVQVTKQDGQVLEYSLTDLRRSSDISNIPTLEHGDIIWIPQSTF